VVLDPFLSFSAVITSPPQQMEFLPITMIIENRIDKEHRQIMGVTKLGLRILDKKISGPGRNCICSLRNGTSDGTFATPTHLNYSNKFDHPTSLSEKPHMKIKRLHRRRRYPWQGDCGVWVKCEDPVQVCRY
jgi:hypothetical protein